MNEQQALLKQEIDMIKNPACKAFTIYALGKAPLYFWLVPSSSTSKYHPAQSNGEGGLVRHTKSCAYFADIFCRAFDQTGNDRDAIISAAILHDIVKYGVGEMQRHTTKTHDKDGADYVLNLGTQFLIDYADRCADHEFTRSSLFTICKAIAYHMGQWTVPEGRRKAFPEGYSKAEMIVHLADMASAGREVSLTRLMEPTVGIG